MAQVVQTDVAEARLRADLVPGGHEPVAAKRPVAPPSRKHPGRGPVDPVEHRQRGTGRPDGPRSRLAVAKEQGALTKVGPAQCQDLRSPAPRQEEKPDRRDRQRPVALPCPEARPENADLRVGQEPLPALAPVPSDAEAGIGAFLPVAHALRLSHDDRQDRHGPVRRDRRRAKRREPVHDVLPRDLRDLESGEPGQDLAAQVASVHLHRAGLPGPLVPAESRLRDSLEDRILRTCGQGAVLPDRGQHRCRARACLARADLVGVADDLPNAPAVVLAVDEPALCARRHHPDAEAFRLPVADVAGGLSRFERPDPGVGEGG